MICRWRAVGRVRLLTLRNLRDRKKAQRVNAEFLTRQDGIVHQLLPLTTLSRTVLFSPRTPEFPLTIEYGDEAILACGLRPLALPRSLVHFIHPLGHLVHLLLHLLHVFLSVLH